MHEIAFENRLCFPFRVYRPSCLNRQACDPNHAARPVCTWYEWDDRALCTSHPHVMTADRVPRGPAAPTTVSSDLQACLRARRSSGSLYTSPCPTDCLLRSRSIHTTPRRLSAHSYRVAPADHPVAVPEKYGSAGNERPKTSFLANNFGNGGPMFGSLCRITSNYTADIFNMDLARYSYRWRKFSQVGQTYHWYTWDLRCAYWGVPKNNRCVPPQKKIVSLFLINKLIYFMAEFIAYNNKYIIISATWRGFTNERIHGPLLSFISYQYYTVFIIYYSVRYHLHVNYSVLRLMKFAVSKIVSLFLSVGDYFSTCGLKTTVSFCTKNNQKRSFILFLGIWPQNIFSGGQRVSMWNKYGQRFQPGVSGFDGFNSFFLISSRL